MCEYVELIKSFCIDLEIKEPKQLADFCFSEDKFTKSRKYAKYKKNPDPDNMEIVKCIYMVLWGNQFKNLESIDDIGPWGRNIRKNYRGDTMNSYNSIEKMITNPDYYTLKLLETYKKNYHRIGNFILIPNRGNINSQKGSTKPKGFVQDSFDIFLYAMKEEYKGKWISKICYGDNILDYFGEDNKPKYYDKMKEFFIEDYFDKAGEPIQLLINNDYTGWLERVNNIIDDRSEKISKKLFKMMPDLNNFESKEIL